MTPQITICFTYFKSLTLANLRAALHSVRKQDLSNVEELIIVDNDTTDTAQDIQEIINALMFPMRTNLISVKHGNSSFTHAWSTNIAVRAASTPWVLFTRADYLLSFNALDRFTSVIIPRSEDWNGFVTGHVYHLSVDIATCEQTWWRVDGPSGLQAFAGSEADYTVIDAGVWMARRDAFEHVHGLDESLTAWGHAQTYFQYCMYKAGVEFVRIPEILFYHPQHSAPRDIELAHQQLRDQGVDIKELWARHDGVQPY